MAIILFRLERGTARRHAISQRISDARVHAVGLTAHWLVFSASYTANRWRPQDATAFGASLASRCTGSKIYVAFLASDDASLQRRYHTHRDHEIEVDGIGCREFVPALAAQSIRGEIKLLQTARGPRIDLSVRNVSMALRHLES